MAQRPKLFEEIPDADLSRFAPRTNRPAPAGPALQEIRAVSAAAGFPSREPAPLAQPVQPKRERNYFRTGRDTQFNTKVKRETKDAFEALAREDGVPMGKLIEDALAALMRERQRRS
jgi:hypothetical protein